MARRPYRPRRSYPTKYGNKRIREELQYRYDTGTPEYRRQVDRDKAGCWAIVIGISVVVFVLMWIVAGPEAAIKWLK